MSFIKKINESPIFKLAHILKEALETQRTHKGHLVLAIDPKKLESIAKKYRPDSFPDLKPSDTNTFSNKDSFSKIKVKPPAAR